MAIIGIKEIIKKTKKLKVLYVEDNEETRKQALKMFSNFFDYIDIAVDGADGLVKYQSQDIKYYDLIISDINMPNMNGIDMVKKILELNRYQNILMLTAYNDTDHLSILIDFGISNYIHKPIMMDTFIHALQKIIENIQIKEKEVEELNEIQKLNHELDALVDSFDTYVIASRTDLQGKITYASKAYETISGYNKSELLGKPHNIVRHPDMPTSVFKNMWKTIKNEELWVSEVKNMNKDGSHYWVKTSIAPYYDINNNHVGYSAIRVDITAQKEVEELHTQIKNLLDNASQGFLSFNKQMEIEKGFSKECTTIFDKPEICYHNIADLLFENDSAKKELFEIGIGNILSTDEELAREMLLSLLPCEHTLNEKDIKIEYKLLEFNKFMMILTDTTKTNQLQKKIKKQNQTQKMIVAIASNKDDFIELKLDFENFLLNPSEDRTVLKRELHTFKGIFAQKEMLHIVDGIHDVETKINNTSLQNPIEIVKSSNLKDIFDLDLEIINKTLTRDFLSQNSSLSVEKSALAKLEEKIKNLQSRYEDKTLNSILNDIERLKDESLYVMLSSYPTAVKQMAQKLEKEVYPLEIVGDKNLKISTKYKPFVKSLIHLFNNCVDHGIEGMEQRAICEKNEIATITCTYTTIDNHLQIKITDDGKGIDLEKLTQKATEKGLEIPDEVSMLVFADSLSTKQELSTTSGRGIGMSAIKSEIDKLDGTISINNTIGKGVGFVFTLPLTQNVTDKSNIKEEATC